MAEFTEGESPTLSQHVARWHLWDYVLRFTDDFDNVVVKSLDEHHLVGANTMKRQQIIDEMVGQGRINVKETGMKALYSENPIFQYYWVDLQTKKVIIHTDYVRTGMWNNVYYLFGQHLKTTPV